MAQTKEEEVPERKEHMIHVIDDGDDEYVIMLKQTGCYAEHLTLQDCYFEKKDWRACKSEMLAFKKCMTFKKGKGDVGVNK